MATRSVLRKQAGVLRSVTVERVPGEAVAGRGARAFGALNGEVADVSPRARPRS